MTAEEILKDLGDRLEQKSQILAGMAIDAPEGPHRARLEGKRQGVALAKSFVYDYLRDLQP